MPERAAGPSPAGDGGFGAFLLRSFAVMREQAPHAYGTLCATLARRDVRLEVDGEVTVLRFTAHDATAITRDGRPAIDVRTSRDAILDLIDGRGTLLDAVLADRLLLRGDPDRLLEFHDGLVAYVHGAVRAPSFPGLLREYRAAPVTGASSSSRPRAAADHGDAPLPGAIGEVR